jgi:hypothetical protein
VTLVDKQEASHVHLNMSHAHLNSFAVSSASRRCRIVVLATTSTLSCQVVRMALVIACYFEYIQIDRSLVERALEVDR